jgi:non-ribosomal peptide synthetase component F
VIGMVAIEMIGGVYCPLSPRDPEHRLHALLQQTESQLVLVHYLTNPKFNDTFISINIDSLLINSNAESDIDLNIFSSIVISSDNIAYIAFTSGSTGTPKAVSSLLLPRHLPHFSDLFRFRFDIAIY